MEVFLFALVLVSTVILTVVAVRLQRRRTSGAERQRILGLWQALHTIESLPMKVLHGDAVLGKALEAAGYTGSVGEMLKQAGPRFTNENAVWKAHKLRNAIAHEPGKKVTEQEATQALRALKQAIDDVFSLI